MNYELDANGQSRALPSDLHLPYDDFGLMHDAHPLLMSTEDLTLQMNSASLQSPRKSLGDIDSIFSKTGMSDGGQRDLQAVHYPGGHSMHAESESAVQDLETTEKPSDESGGIVCHYPEENPFAIQTNDMDGMPDNIDADLPSPALLPLEEDEFSDIDADVLLPQRDAESSSEPWFQLLDDDLMHTASFSSEDGVQFVTPTAETVAAIKSIGSSEDLQRHREAQLAHWKVAQERLRRSQSESRITDSRSHHSSSPLIVTRNPSSSVDARVTDEDGRDVDFKALSRKLDQRDDKASDNSSLNCLGRTPASKKARTGGYDLSNLFGYCLGSRG